MDQTVMTSRADNKTNGYTRHRHPFAIDTEIKSQWSDNLSAVLRARRPL